MASYGGSVFEEPQCLVRSDPDNKLTVVKHVLDQLCGVKEQLNVVTIAGLYRTGKSYLMTRLANKYKGFPLGSTIESKTKGIWAWCVKHPVHKDQMLLLLDTEGLGDIQKGSQNHDNQIFTLATLLSSTLIYNTFGAFDQDAINKLNFITEISKNMKTSEAKSGNDNNFDLYFPEFILALRDFTLDLEAEGQTMTSDQYLEFCLRLQSGEGEEIARFNEPKRCLRKYFKKRKCFVFERPAKTKFLRKLEELQDEDLDDDFVENTRTFTNYVHRNCEPLSLMNGKPVNGRMFASLLTSYINAIRNGAVPCIESALKSMAIIENEKAVKAAVIAYNTEMSGKLVMPTPDEKTINDLHLHCKNVAFNVFKKQSVMDEGNKYKMEADVIIDKEFGNFVRQNREESEKRCENALQELHKVIANKIHAGVYSVAGGYEMYRADRGDLERNYFAKANLGLKRQEAYIAFTYLTRNEEESILKADKMVTQKEKENEIERQKTKRAQDKEKMFKEQFENTKVEMKEMQAQLEQEMCSLKEQQREEIENIGVKYEDITNKRIQEMNRLEQENMTKMSQKYREDLTNALAERDERDRSVRQEIANAHEARLRDLENMREQRERDIQKANERYEELLRQQRKRDDGGCTLL